MTRLYVVKNALRFTDKEQFLISKKFPGLDNDHAKRFLKSGEWVEIEPDTVLIQHNQTTNFLYFLYEGRAAIMRKEVKIAICEKGDFLGEVTCFDGKPATGTVKTTEKVDCFRIPIERLQEVAPAGSILRQRLEESIAFDLRIKLSDLSHRFEEGLTVSS